MVSEAELKNDLLPDAAAAVDFLGTEFNRNKVYYMARTGQIRCIRKGSRLLFRKSWLIEDFSQPAGAVEAI